MQKNLLRFVIPLILTLLLSGCMSPASPTPQASNGPTETLRPYPSDTHTLTPYPTGFATSTQTPTITPTMTPVFYKVSGDDDLFGIALRYGVPLEALKTANPSVIPNAMGEGTVLMIPVTSTAPPKPTDTPLVSQTTAGTQSVEAVLQTDCYRDGLGGIYCFVSYPNESDKPLENVSAVVSLTALSGDYKQDQVAILPLNILPAHTTLPLVTYFQPPTPELFSAVAVPDFSLPVSSSDERYLAAQITDITVEMDANGISAAVGGIVSLTDPLEPAGSIWVLGVGYAADGRVVGFRRWEATHPIPYTQTIPFTFNIYSLGARLNHVDLFVEARPVLP